MDMPASHINEGINAAAEAAAAGATAKVSLVGGGFGGFMSFVAWIEYSGLGTLIGVFFAVAGFGLSWYYSRKRHRLENIVAQERIRRWREISEASRKLIDQGLDPQNALVKLLMSGQPLAGDSDLGELKDE